MIMQAGARGRRSAVAYIRRVSRPYSRALGAYLSAFLRAAPSP